MNMLAAAATLLAAAAATPSAQSQARLDYTLGVSALHSDNIGLDVVDPQTDTVLAPSIGATYTQTGSVFEARLAGNLQYLDYLENSFDDELRGAFSGRAQWTLLPDRLQLVAEDYLSRQPVDSLAAFSPGNQQQTNVFVFGPTLSGRIGSTLAQLDARYGRSTAEDDDSFDSDRISLAGRLQRELSPARRLSASVQATRVGFDGGTVVADADARDGDYTRYDAFATYDSTLRVIDFDVEAGYSQLRYEDDRGTASGPLLRSALTWRASPRSELTGRIAYQFSDAAQSLSAGIGDAAVPVSSPIGTTSAPVRPDVFRERRIELGYRFNGTRLDLSAAPYYQRIRYVDAVLPGQVALDQDSIGGIATVDYRLRERTSLSLIAAFAQRDYDTIDRRDDDSVAGIGLVQRFSRQWSARIDLQRRLRSSTIPGQDYDETASTVSVAWRR